MRNNNIIVDIDGVVCQYNFGELIKRHFGLTIPNELIYCYSIEDALGVSSKEVEKMFSEACKEKPNLVNGATIGLTKLQTKGYNILILSNRLRYQTPTELEDWLDDNQIPYGQVVTFKTLPEFVVAHIDDSPTKLIQVADETKVGKSILFEQPWNSRCHDICNRFTWVNSWNQILEELSG